MVSQDSVPIFRRTFTPTWHLTLGTTIFATPQISAKLIFPIYAAYVHDQPFLNYTRRWNLFISPEIEISVRLRKPEANDEKKRSFVFARIKYFDMPMVSQNNFWQIQTGIEIPLSNLFDN